MQSKMWDNNIKYFSAISENKRKDLELKYAESQIDRLQTKMLTRYWKDKISVFDEMIRLNVKTPAYDSERALQQYLSERAPGGGATAAGDKYTCTMGPMNIDSKLLSNKPVSLQRGKKAASGLEPVISIEGNDAVCYPTKEARRGRKVGLNAQVLRRMEQCKALEDSITEARTRGSTPRQDAAYSPFQRNGFPARRPKTAPRPGGRSKAGHPRPVTSVARLQTHATPVTDFKAWQAVDERPPTVMSSGTKRGWTPSSQRPDTSLSIRPLATSVD